MPFSEDRPCPLSSGPEDREGLQKKKRERHREGASQKEEGRKGKDSQVPSSQSHPERKKPDAP